MSTVYASIGLGRIQTHLARTRHLWGRRGASDELALLTDNKAGYLAAILTEGVEVNDEALSIDGEIPLRSAAGTDPARAEAQVLEASHRIIRHIQERLPAVEATVRLWRADGYIDTLAHEPGRELTYTPAVPEYPPVKLCDECQSGEAVHTVGPPAPDYLHGTDLCRDCATRVPEPGRQQTLERLLACPSEVRGFVVERKLLKETGRNPVDDFTDLAKSVGVTAGRTHTTEHNHLALVFADANGLGGIFRTLRTRVGESGGDEAAQHLQTMKDISTTIKKATWAALLAATNEACARRVADEKKKKGQLPVIPHILGGDDLLVTVPATLVWPFFTTFMDSLKEAFESTLPEHLKPYGLGLPSVSAGIVICQTAFPFGVQVDLVNQLIRDAKQHGQGSDWTFTWLDVTADGQIPLPPSERVPWTLDQLTERTRALTELRTEVTGSSEGSLRADLSDPDLAAAALKAEHRARRLPAVAALFKACGVPARLTDSDVRLLRDVINLGRWWR